MANKLPTFDRLINPLLRALEERLLDLKRNSTITSIGISPPPLSGL